MFCCMNGFLVGGRDVQSDSDKETCKRIILRRDCWEFDQYSTEVDKC